MSIDPSAAAAAKAEEKAKKKERFVVDFLGEDLDQKEAFAKSKLRCTAFLFRLA